MGDSSIMARPILDLVVGYCWTRCQLRGGITYVSVASKPMNPPTFLRVVLYRYLNSMADTSTTGGPIQDLIAGDCWAGYQLRCSIG